jgi:NodT family efflux transporter outer membrane factor (OMF) lipoprotein
VTFYKKMKPGLWVALLAFVAQSCFVAKNYERPEGLTPESLYRTNQLPADSNSLGQVSWREVFTDPILVTYIEKGLSNNLDIRIALQGIISAEAYLKQGKAGYLPSISARAQWTHQELAQNSQFGRFFNGTLDQYELSGTLSWEADIWGKIRSQKRAFEATYLQTMEAHKAVKTRLVANIASSYYNLLSLDEQLRITRQTVANRQNSLETTKALKDAGTLTEVGVQQTEAQLYTAQLLVANLENQITLQENALRILLGEGPSAIERGLLKDQHTDSAFSIGVPAQLLSNRPDVRAAEYQLVNAFELTNVSRSNFYPSLTLSATGGYQSLQLENWITPQSIFFNVVSGLTQPIFNQRKIRTQHEAAQAAREQALLRFEQSLLTAGREVSDALSTYKNTQARIALKSKEYNAYNKASQYSEELLNNGLANYLEVLTARENALNSQLGLVQLQYQEMNSFIQLYTALGGGWQ